MISTHKIMKNKNKKVKGLSPHNTTELAHRTCTANLSCLASGQVVTSGGSQFWLPSNRTTWKNQLDESCDMLKGTKRRSFGVKRGMSNHNIRTFQSALGFQNLSSEFGFALILFIYSWSGVCLIWAHLFIDSLGFISPRSPNLVVSTLTPTKLGVYSEPNVIRTSS